LIAPPQIAYTAGRSTSTAAAVGSGSVPRHERSPEHHVLDAMLGACPASNCLYDERRLETRDRDPQIRRVMQDATGPGLVADGPGGLLAVPTAAEALALVHMAVPVTAVAFLLWYGAVERLGVERAGLFSGVLPVSALLTSAALAGTSLSPARLLGVLAVAAGISAGMWVSRPPSSRRAPVAARPAPAPAPE
jgi:hypothetical protein